VCLPCVVPDLRVCGRKVAGGLMLPSDLQPLGVVRLGCGRREPEALMQRQHSSPADDGHPAPVVGEGGSPVLSFVPPIEAVWVVALVCGRRVSGVLQ
jgi:hypothetical protein